MDSLRLLSLWRVFVLLCLPLACAEAQTPFRAMFWNVENLFDTYDDPRKNDNEFLPDAKRRWTPARYRDKLHKVARTIAASGHDRVPDVVGLCEVENDTCLVDLLGHTPLREAGYRYVMTHSPDFRGIDVALLYQPGRFRLIASRAIRIPHKQLKKGPTRDILHVVGEVLSGDTLDLFVCHMPSRSTGKLKSEPYRLLTASILKQAADSVMRLRRHPYVLVMGDFNDYPRDKSLKRLCSDGRLLNLMEGRKDGTYSYRGEWGILDHFLVSATLLKKRSSLRTSHRQVTILRHDFLLKASARKQIVAPFRTYNGLKYRGGYSDHLPIALDISLH